MIVKFNNFRCYLPNDTPKRSKQVKEILEVVDKKISKGFENLEELDKININFTFFTPEMRYVAKTINVKILNDGEFTHDIILPHVFFLDLDKSLFDSCLKTLLHELIHCFLDHTYAISKQHQDKEERRVDKIVKQLLEE